MPITPGKYAIGFGDVRGVDRFLTDNGEGKQLTVEPMVGEFSDSQLWMIELPSGAENNSRDRIIRPSIPALAKEILAVSQDVVKSPDEVSLIKNLQVWTFDPVTGFDSPENEVFEIRSNLYTGLVGTDPLLTVSEYKVIIKSVRLGSPARPVWSVIGPILELQFQQGKWTVQRT